MMRSLMQKVLGAEPPPLNKQPFLSAVKRLDKQYLVQKRDSIIKRSKQITQLKESILKEQRKLQEIEESQQLEKDEYEELQNMMNNHISLDKAERMLVSARQKQLNSIYDHANQETQFDQTL